MVTKDYDACKEISKTFTLIVDTRERDTDRYHQRIARFEDALWKDDRSEHSKELLSELCEAIEENMDSIALGLCYEKAEYDPANLLKFIDECRERKIPFKDLQSWLALISDVHNKEKITAVQMLSSTFVPQPIHRFCIDLNKLNELLGI